MPALRDQKTDFLFRFIQRSAGDLIGPLGTSCHQFLKVFLLPDQALEFYRNTGVDALAVAIGNAHGNYKQTPHLRFDILKQTASLVPVPLVLHGGTGIAPDDFRKCVSIGIHKINIATATFDSVEKTVRESYEGGKISGYYDLQAAEVEGAYLNAMKHIEIFGCAGKA